METAINLEQPEAWGERYVTGADWARLQNVLALVRREHHQTELSPERREQIRERVLERVEKLEARRQRWRMLVARASIVFFAGVMLTVLLVRRVLRD
jgi:hypothetical protein